ncbi:hypothetical protein [Saccharopolyspora shandongensis]|uniref:hypothetical protein n=1 Tax=Saccharopolyspora shandongensis TaxID=418495 RepID=UPI0033F188AE
MITRRVRRPAGLAAIACALVVLVLGARHGGQAGPGGLDLAVEHWLRTHIADQQLRVLHGIAELGDRSPTMAATALVTSIGYLSGRWTHVLLAALAPATAIVLSQLLKPLIGRTINDYWALPSGHTTGLVALLGVVGVFLLHRTNIYLSVLRGLAFAGLGFVATVMVVVLIRMHLHYTTDVVAGACLAFSAVIGIALLLDRLDERWRASTGIPHDQGG